jgi:hypothetical protein
MFYIRYPTSSSQVSLPELLLSILTSRTRPMNMIGLHCGLVGTTWNIIIFSRSRILSLNIGLLFFGVALGPTLGSLLIRATGQTLSVFYAAVSFTFVYSFFLWFILPESVTEQQMTRARAKYNDDLLRGCPEGERSSTAAWLHKIKQATSFFSPLNIFLPSSLESPDNGASRHRRDWSLTLLALAYGCTISTMVASSIDSY